MVLVFEQRDEFGVAEFGEVDLDGGLLLSVSFGITIFLFIVSFCWTFGR